MRGALIGLLFTVCTLLFVGSVQLGITPAYLVHGPEVASGIGAKLLCSAEHVMASDRDQAFADVSQYSPVLEHITVHYDDEAREVTASFMGIKEQTAKYLPGLGCAIVRNDADRRLDVTPRRPTVSDKTWPAGDRVTTIDRRMQGVIEQLVTSDNVAGFNTRALLVVRDGDVVAEAYGQGADAQTPLLGWSMAKSMTAIMLGSLEYRGLIDLNGKPGFQGWERDDRADIAITDLLTMTDGLDFSEQYNPGDDATTMLFTVPSASDYAMQSEAGYPAGTRFNYSSGTANLLARLYGETLGSPQAAYDDLMDNVFKPMGMQHAIFEMDASGQFVGSSYLYASARDWARMGQLMLNNGKLNGQRIFSEDWVQRATTPNRSNNEKAYGYQWWLNTGDDTLRFPGLPADAYFANGNRQQTVMVFPSQRAVIVRLGWTSGWYPVDVQFAEILNQLKR